jgi:hypothetical protein
MSLKHELQNIISGNGSVRNGKIIQAITDYLRRKKETVQATPSTEETFAAGQKGLSIAFDLGQHTAAMIQITNALFRRCRKSRCCH